LLLEVIFTTVKSQVQYYKDEYIFNFTATAMLFGPLCWFLGTLLLAGGMIASLYLVWLQVHRGVTGFSLLATSDALATVAISITFLLNASDNHDTGRIATVCIHNYIYHNIANLQNGMVFHMYISHDRAQTFNTQANH
jgi:hypothetical protein